MGIPTNMGLDHVGIVVPNVRSAADFLIEVFDAEFDWEVIREPSPNAGERGWDKIFGVNSESYMPHVMMLKCGSNQLCQYIELFEWKRTNGEEDVLPGEGNWHRFDDLANSYISFTVKDLDAVMDHIKKFVIPKWKGTRFIQDPAMEFPLRGEVCASTFLVSPWGMWIEISCWSKSKEYGTLVPNLQKLYKDPIIGQHIDKLPTPSFMIDLDIVDHNISIIKERLDKNGIAWRAPCKAHKCPDFTKYMQAKGLEGIVLLTLEEVEKFAKEGIQDIYFANQLFEKSQIERLVSVGKQVKKLRVAADSIEYVKDLEEAVKKWEILTPIEVLVELNINHDRCGATITEAVELAKYINRIENDSGALIFKGITGYEGHTPLMEPVKKTEETINSHNILKEAKRLIQENGIEVDVVSAGGSCNYIDCINTGVVNEIQSGGGALGDLLYCEKANLGKHGHKPGSLILAQITNTPDDGKRCVANAGFKSTGWHPFGGMPQPRDRQDLEVTGLSAEHTRMKPSQLSKSGKTDVKRGEKIVLITGYTDAMGFMHDKIYAIRNDHVEYIWETV